MPAGNSAVRALAGVQAPRTPWSGSFGWGPTWTTVLLNMSHGCNWTLFKWSHISSYSSLSCSALLEYNLLKVGGTVWICLSLYSLCLTHCLAQNEPLIDIYVSVTESNFLSLTVTVTTLSSTYPCHFHSVDNPHTKIIKTFPEVSTCHYLHQNHTRNGETLRSSKKQGTTVFTRDPTHAYHFFVFNVYLVFVIFCILSVKWITVYLENDKDQ